MATATNPTTVTFTGTKNYSQSIPHPRHLKLQAELFLDDASKTFTYTQHANEIICESVVKKEWKIVGTYVATDASITCTVQEAQQLYHEQGDIIIRNAPPPVPPTLQVDASAVGQTLVFNKTSTVSVELVQAFSHVVTKVTLSCGSSCSIL